MSKERIEELRSQVIQHDLKYDQGEPTITDSEYDRLYNQLITLEKKYPEYQTKDSPTQKIYGVLMDELSKVTHGDPLLSLNKENTREGILKFVNRFDEDTIITAGLKEDGLTIKLVYENGILIQASTRGTGTLGEDVTHSIRGLPSVPNFIEYDKRLEIRGEAIIPFEAFDRINVEGKYKSPRNLVSGSVRTLESNVARDRGVEINVFDVLNEGDVGYDTELQSLEFLEELGFQVTEGEFFLNNEEGKQELLDYCLNFETRERKNIGHMIDGLVLKVNDYELRSTLGVTRKHPRWAIAFKFDSMDATTTITDVVWTVGKTGQITPNAVLEPVEIDGVTIERASLANYANILLRDIRINDTVVVARANDVIPQVVAPVKEERTGNEIEVELLEFCPSCESKLDQEKGKDSLGNGSVTLYCTNALCKAQMIRVLENFVSRNVMDIDGLGAETVATLYNEGFIHGIEDIYKLHEWKDDILTLDRFGETSVNKMLKGIEESKNQPLENVIKGLGVRNIGNNVSEILTDEYKTWDELKVAATNGELENYLEGVDGIGETLQEAVLTTFTNKNIIQTMDALKKYGCKMEQPQVEKEDTLAGNTFVITGKLSKPRKEIQTVIENMGGKVTGSVSKNTTYLVLGGYNDSTGEFEGSKSSKHTKAEDLGIPIISEEKLYTLM